MASSLNKGYIRDIVAQVKSGAKSKTDAFNELKQILQKKLELYPYLFLKKASGGIKKTEKFMKLTILIY